jgi:GTPase involved in cell partitioning and DNA repair
LKEKNVICDLLEERLEPSISKDEFIKIFLEFKTRLEGSSRENLMFLIETFRETKKIERNIDQVENDLNKFFDGLESKTKYIIQKDIEKMKQNFLTCSQKIQDFFQSYYSREIL